MQILAAEWCRVRAAVSVFGDALGLRPSPAGAAVTAAWPFWRAEIPHGSQRSGVRGRFGRLLAASTVSRLGSGLHLAAFPILATSLTSDPRVIAVVALASAVPGIALALPVGAWVDRSHRGRLMVGSDLACAAVLAGFVALMAFGALRLWMLFAAVLLGIAELVFGTSSFALVPSLVPAEELERANGRLATVAEIGEGMIGPAIGGSAHAAAPLLPFAINGLSYLGSSALIGSFARHRQPRRAAADTAPPPGHRGSSRWRELVAGSAWSPGTAPPGPRWCWPARRGCSAGCPKAPWCCSPARICMPRPGQIGLLLAITTVGAVLGGLLAGRVARRWGPAVVLAVTYGMYGALLIPVAFAGSVLLVAVIFLVQGLPLIICNATISSVQQRAVPDDLLGRFAAVRRVVDGAVVPLGLAAGGFLGGWLGLRPVWAIAGIGFLGVLALNSAALRALATNRSATGSSTPTPTTEHD